MFYPGATLQTPQWIFHQQKVHIILTGFWGKFPEQSRIEGHRFENQHVRVSQPGGHGIAAAMK